MSLNAGRRRFLVAAAASLAMSRHRRATRPRRTIRIAAVNPPASDGEQLGVDQLRNAGMPIVDNVDRTALAAAAHPALDNIGRRLGAERVARIRELHV